MLLQAIAIGILVTTYGYPFNPKLDKLWNDYKVKFNKHYSAEEEDARRLIWEKAVNKIVDHNLEADFGIHSYRLGINPFADMTHEENEALLKAQTSEDSLCLTSLLPHHKGKVPDQIDWRTKGFVGPVKNQGQCGSPSVMTAVSSLESQNAKSTGRLVKLSLQNLLDCCGPSGGCEGGESIDQYFLCVVKMGGIDSETYYPPGKEGECRFNKSGIAVKCKGCVFLPSGNEEALKVAVATIGPIATYVDASSIDFQLYSGGIYDNPDCSSTELDHSLLIIGYGTENGNDYWLLQNSWGPEWGLNGYIKMSRNKGNQCGIATYPLYPLV